MQRASLKLPLSEVLSRRRRRLSTTDVSIFYVCSVYSECEGESSLWKNFTQRRRRIDIPTRIPIHHNPKFFHNGFEE